MLIHTFDKTEDSKHPFMPASSGWAVDKFGSRWAASIINREQGSGLYGGGAAGGVIIAPQYAKVLCSYMEDGGSMNIDGGCRPTACVPTYPWKCSWHGASGLEGMMWAQRKWKKGRGYNEVVLDTRNWTRGGVEAIFEAYPHAGSARSVHADMLTSYGLTREEMPMLLLNWSGWNDGLFEEAPP